MAQGKKGRSLKAMLAHTGFTHRADNTNEAKQCLTPSEDGNIKVLLTRAFMESLFSFLREEPLDIEQQLSNDQPVVRRELEEMVDGVSTLEDHSSEQGEGRETFQQEVL
ncbi:hypothetical protein NDU88_009137 [Pleurodeles waltl]|uniref:Uncharacterized protein n=1 Tax=Pleurodeles waltl TaxID=8319 RepID=A0AAV7QSQ7_PLEWA|nr:hypothetical protein NDU88_009137 [Pleurodeles waltl]